MSVTFFLMPLSSVLFFLMQKHAMCKQPLRMLQMSCKDIKIVSCFPKVFYSKKQVWQMRFAIAHGEHGELLIGILSD